MKINRQKFDELRKKAKDTLSSNEVSGFDDYVNDVEKLIEELQISYIELEMQNDELQKTNQLLENEKKNFAELYLNAPIAYITINNIGNIYRINNSAAKLLGLPVHQFKFTSIFPYIQDKSKISFKKFVDEVTVASEPIETKITLVNYQGNIIDAKISAISYADIETDKVLYRLTITDLTEETIKLKESEEKYRMMFNYMMHAFALHEMLYDAEGNPIDYRFLDVNPAFERLTGLRAADVVGKSLLEILPNTESYWIEEYGKVAKTGTPMYFINFSKELGKFFETYSFSPEKNKFAVFFTDVTERREMEISLIEKQRALDSSINAIAIADLDGSLTYVNQSFLDTWGYFSTKEVIGRSAVEFWKDVEEAELVIKALFEKGSYRGELIGKHSDGTYFEVEISASLVLDEYGNPISLLAAFVDLTERKNSELQIQEVKEKYIQLFETNTDGISLFKVYPDGTTSNLLMMNESAAKTIGYTKEELLEKKPIDLEVPVSPELTFARVSKLQTEGKVRFETQIIHKDGRKIDVEINAIMTQIDGEPAVLNITRDITERKQIERTLVESEKMFKAIFDYANDGIMLADIHTREISKANDKARKLFRYDNINQLIGLRADDIHPDDFIPNIPVIFNSKTKNNEYISEVYPMKRKDGSIFYAEVTSSLLELDNKDYMLGIFRDISDRLRIENELRESEAMLRKSQEIAKMGNWELDLVNNKLYWSDEIFRIFGAEPQSFDSTYESFVSFIHPDDRDMVDKAYKESLISKSDYQITHRLLLPDGTIKYVEERCLNEFNSEGEPILSKGIVFDVTQHYIAEEKIRESEAKYRTLFNFMPFGVSLADKNGNLLENNNEAIHLLGLSPEELADREIGGDKWAIIRPDGSIMPPEEFASVRALNENRRIENVVMGLVKPNKSITWITVTAEPFNFGDYGLVIAYLDITQRINAEKALKESEMKFKSFFDFAGIFLGIIDLDGKFIAVNQYFYQSLGYEKFEILKLTNKAITYHEDYGKSIEYQKQLIDGNITNYNYEKRYYHKNGSIIWVDMSVVPLKDVNGKVVGLIGAGTDITSKKRIEEELRANETRLDKVVSLYQKKFDTIQEFLDIALNEAVDLTNSKIGYIYFYDDAKQEFVLNSWSSGVMNECSIMEKHRRYELEKTGLWGEAVRQAKPIIVNDYHAPNSLKKGYPEGHSKLNNFMTIPIFSNDKIVAVVGLANKETDYTQTDVLQLTLLMDSVWRVVERKQEEEIRLKLLNELTKSQEELEASLLQKNALIDELAESQEKLKETIANKDKFFSIIAHDLRSPMSAFVGLTRMISDDADNLSIKDLRQMSETIHDSANALYNLLNELLQWARTQTGGIPYNPEELDLYEILFNNVYILNKFAKDKNIEIKINAKDDSLVRCDRNMIMTVVRNLLDNAIKFSNPYSEIIVNCVLINDDFNRDFYQVSITDNGAGIPEDVMKRLFQIGSEVTRTGTRGERGTGLGLILCKEFIDKHDGKIWAETQMGKGSTFYFTLPKLV